MLLIPVHIQMINLAQERKAVPEEKKEKKRKRGKRVLELRSIKWEVATE